MVHILTFMCNTSSALTHHFSPKAMFTTVHISINFRVQ